jgi:hypothetical protein
LAVVFPNNSILFLHMKYIITFIITLAIM